MDIRIQRTRAPLRGAVRDLTRDRALEDVSITDICARAGVNRSSFYQHNPNKETLAADSIEVGEVPLEFVAAGVASSTLGMLGLWLTQEDRAPVDTVTQWIITVLEGRGPARGSTTHPDPNRRTIMKNKLQPLDLPEQTGRTWLVTGATNGVGREVARSASRAGARVLLTARDAARGEALRTELGDARVIDVDLADLSRVRAAAAGVDEPIDVLVNCAGRMSVRREETVDGFEAMMGTNFLGPFAFTNLVADRVRGRVVIVGSDAHRRARLDLDDLQLTSGWSPARGYARSKLADMLWGLELGRRLGPRGIPVMLVHPGWVLTNIQNLFSPWANRAVTALSSVMAQSSVDAAQTVLVAATSELPNGSYVGPSGWNAFRGAPTLLGRSTTAADPVRARQLWEVAAGLTGTDLT